MIVERLENPTCEDLADILELFKRIKKRTCTASAFLAWLDQQWGNLCVPVIRDEGRIVGFTVAETPSILDPKTGWLPFTSLASGLPRQFVSEGLRMAEDWLKEQGATKYIYQSQRSPRALLRAYGIKPSKEVLYEKQIR